LKDCGIAHWAIDSDHENAILKRFIAVATPDVAKTLLPLPEIQPSRVALPSPHLRKLRRALHSDNA
jgi:hypothetical protein